jgi:Protein of unknown function (DUF3108)
MSKFWKPNPVSCLLLLLWFSAPQSNLSLAQAPLPTISAAPVSVIVPPPPGYRYPDGQTYVYGVEWHMFNAGTAVVKLQGDSGGQHVIATAVSAGVFNALYRVNDHMDAFFDARNFCSQRISKHIEEGSKSRESELHFDYAHAKSVLDEKNLKTGEQKHLENDIPRCVTDVASGFYYLASLPLQTGNSYTFTLSDGKTNQISAHVEGREQVKVPAGTFQTVRLRAEAISGTLKEKGTVWAWFTDDANHTPVQMRSKAGWGALLFRLQRVERQ